MNEPIQLNILDESAPALDRLMYAIRYINYLELENTRLREENKILTTAQDTFDSNYWSNDDY